MPTKIDTKCPTCKTPIPKERWMKTGGQVSASLRSRSYTFTLVPCPFCGDEVKASLLRAHRVTCKKGWKCPVCHRKIALDAKESHIKSECPGAPRSRKRTELRDDIAALAKKGKL